MTPPPPPDNWNIDRLDTERMQAVAAFGLTERQAHFLVTVMVHAGVFLERQYCAFAGIRTCSAQPPGVEAVTVLGSNLPPAIARSI